MTTLCLGVDDIPYARAMSAPQRRAARWRQGRPPWRGLGGLTTTGDVAEILERKYGIVSTFALLHGQDIIDGVEHAMQDKLENLLMGGPVSDELFSPGDLGSIEQAFRAFLDNRGMDGRASGVPTGAAERGVNPRLAHPYARGNPARPSFIASGLYQASFRAFIME